MTGPEHYREAEKHIARARERMTDLDEGERDTREHLDLAQGTREHLALAQVHATLAHAAATALTAPPDDMTGDDLREWMAAASEYKRPADVL